MRPTTIHEVARRRSLQPNVSLWKPMNEFLDSFYDEDRVRLRDMLKQEPEADIDPKEKAYLAASVEYLCSAYKLELPEWTLKSEYFLIQAWWPEDFGPKGRALFIAESPTSFRKRFIFTERYPLRRKRGPVFVEV